VIDTRSGELELSSSSSTAPAPCHRDVLPAGPATVGDCTLKTTDSGIGSIAQRPARRSADARLLAVDYSQTGTGSACDDDDDDDDDEPMSAAESTPFSDDVDVALMWHLARCSTIVQVQLDDVLLIPQSRSCSKVN